MFHRRTCDIVSCMTSIRMLLTVMMFVPAAYSVLVGPNNTVVFAGTAMTMTCEPSPGGEVIGWGVYTIAYKYFLLENGCSAADETVNDLETYEDINGHNVGTGNTLSTHAGLYECLVSEARGSKSRVLGRASANLIVLESNPIGKITKAEGEIEITLHCSVTYSGLWPPTVEWRLNGQREESTPEQTRNRVSATLRIWPTTGKRNYSQYSCVTYFDASKKPDNFSASNVPSFVYTWTPHEPRNIEISPRKETFVHSEELLCSADADPEATYTWTNMEIGNIISGPKLVVPLADGMYKFQCKADNGVGNVATANISFMAKGSNDSQTFLVIVYVPLVLGAAILLPLIAICIGKHRCARAQNNSSPGVRTHSSSSARRGKNSRKPKACAELPTADVEYDDVISPSSNTAQGYMALAPRDNNPASDYTEVQIDPKYIN